MADIFMQCFSNIICWHNTSTLIWANALNIDFLLKMTFIQQLLIQTTPSIQVKVKHTRKFLHYPSLWKWRWISRHRPHNRMFKQLMNDMNPPRSPCHQAWIVWNTLPHIMDPHIPILDKVCYYKNCPKLFINNVAFYSSYFAIH